MNKNVIALPYWAKEIFSKLECNKTSIYTILGKTLYCGIGSYLQFVVSEEDEEGKPIYLVSYSRTDDSMTNDIDKDYATSRLVPLLGEPVYFREGGVCDYIAFNRKVN